MSEESRLSQPIPLSHAKKNRRANDNNDNINFSEARLKEILNETVYEPLVTRITRLEKSMNLTANQFEGFKNGNSEDAALRITTDSEASDLALASVVPQEDLYPYLCQDLAEKLEIRSYDVTQMIKKLGLRNNPKYSITYQR